MPIAPMRTSTTPAGTTPAATMPARTSSGPQPAAAHTAPAWRDLLATLALLVTLVVVPGAAFAQTPERAGTPAAAPSPTPQPDPATALFGTFVQGVATMGAGFGQMVGTRDAGEAARTAATAVTKLPMSGITAGHERCTIAPNGAPDCVVAARTLCRGKGFTGGTSVDFMTVENCPPEYRTARRADVPAGVCTMEHYVTQALCQ